MINGDTWADKVGVLTPEQFDEAKQRVRERAKQQKEK